MSRLTIVRGLPGSGKSTFAQALAKSDNMVHVEADMYHMRHGEYMFDTDNLSKAHGWCRHSMGIFLHSGHDVVVSNTFVVYDYIRGYIELVPDYLKGLTIINCLVDYGNIHNIPESVMESMKKRWVSDVTADLAKDYGLKMTAHHDYPYHEIWRHEH